MCVWCSFLEGGERERKKKKREAFLSKLTTSILETGKRNENSRGKKNPLFNPNFQP